ncbi:hypothetical protein D6855_08645 [Butyrivibrio sp. CB08]|uniref:LIC_10190 family membrane protein n=1 Tax=Butyrivibrio sp. CB08 TaxID=2364879 RepID=UPI000EA9F6F8|nr:hypothetical protein [Butyrivibrio sp. CB08]RKM59844.1 hypothetical protein D6855_08645 [Butyrivibrio sp. CB08]
MLTVVLIWTYVLITTYLVGYGFLMSLVSLPGMEGARHSRTGKGKRKYDFKFKESFIITGVVLLTVYAQIISLFSKVGLGANIGIIIISLLIAVYYREDIYYDACNRLSTLKVRGDIFVYLFVFLLMAYGTSHGIMHYDSDLYHAQAIRWIEEYGIVKGLGNLHLRLAYNSAAFPLSALFSMSFINGQSYHVMAGFFALLLAWQCVDIMNVPRRGHLIISDFARFAAIYYLSTIFDEMMAPASDYFLSTLVFYIIIHLLDMYVKHERSYVPYILLALVGVFAITVKLSAAPMVLLCVIPLVKLLRHRTKEKMNALWISVGLVLVITLPFLIRNVIISGWLLYPVSFLDLFGFSWKIPKGTAAFDALEIKTFGRGYNDVAAYGNVTFGEWVPHWFESITGLNKIMLILAIASVIVYLFYLLYFVVAFAGKDSDKIRGFGKGKVFDLSKRSMMDTADFLTIGATLIGCLFFWFISAPLIRYGVVYVWLTPLVILGRLFIIVQNRIGKDLKTLIVKVISVVFILWIAYKGVNLVLEDIPRFNPAYLVNQQDYGTYDARTFELGGTTFYYPAEGDQIGYYPFPSATHDISGEIQLMGDTIDSGFISIN